MNISPPKWASKAVAAIAVFAMPLFAHAQQQADAPAQQKSVLKKADKFKADAAQTDTIDFKNFMVREKDATREQKKYGDKVIKDFAKTKRSAEELQAIYGENYPALAEAGFNFKHEVRKGATGILFLDIAQKDTLFSNRILGDNTKNAKGKYHTEQIAYRLADTVVYELPPGYGDPSNAVARRSEYIGIWKDKFLQHIPSGITRFITESGKKNNEMVIKNGNEASALSVTDYRVRPAEPEFSIPDRLYVRETDSTLMPYPRKTTGTPQQEINQMQSGAARFFRQQVSDLVSGVYDPNWQLAVQDIHPNDLKIKTPQQKTVTTPLNSSRLNGNQSSSQNAHDQQAQDQQNKPPAVDYTKGPVNVGTLGASSHSPVKPAAGPAAPVVKHKKNDGPKL